MTVTKAAVLDAVAAVMRRRFGVRAQRAKRFEWPVPASVRQAVAGLPRAAVVRRSPDLAPPRTPLPRGLPVTVAADLYFPPPLNCIVQYDGPRHCTRERAASLAAYPADVPLNFDVRRYLADQSRGNRALVRADVLADLLPPAQGLNPTVRIRADEIAELNGPLPDRIEGLLARRFAFHAGTVFQHMLDNAGAKPHRTL